MNHSFLTEWNKITGESKKQKNAKGAVTSKEKILNSIEKE